MKQGGCEMEAGGGSGNASFRLRVNRLIADLIFLIWSTLDIWREWQLAVTRHGFIRRQAQEPHQPVSIAEDLHRLHRCVLPEAYPFARPQRSPWFSHRDPGVCRSGMDQEYFRWRAGLARAQQPGMPHPGGIEYEQIAGGEKAGKVGKPGILEHRLVPGRASHHQKPTSPPVVRWFLGDQLGRKVVIEIGGLEVLSRQRWSLGLRAA